MKESANILERGNSAAGTILLLAWPIILEQIMLSLVQYVDTAMVGSLGPQATAAVAINQSLVNLVNGLFLSFGVGFTALIARFIGAGNPERARRVVSQAVLVAVGLGLVISVAMCALSQKLPAFMGAEPEILPDAGKYLLIISSTMMFKACSVVLSAITRGEGDTKTPMIVNTGVNIINVIGNYFLIYPTREIAPFGHKMTMYGAGWGVAGAATATSVSIVLGGIVMFIIICKRESEIRLTFEDGLKPDREILLQTFRISLPATGERLSMSIGQILVTMIVSTLGTLPLAAHHIALTAETITYMPSFGIASAATTLVGQSLGAHREDLTDRISKKSIEMAFWVLCVMGVVLFWGAQFMTGIFTPDESVKALAAKCLHIEAFALPLIGISMTIVGALRGAGDTKWTFIVVMISMFTIRVSIAYLLVIVLQKGLEAVWVCMLLDYLLRTLLFSLRYKSGRWKYVMQLN